MGLQALTKARRASTVPSCAPILVSSAAMSFKTIFAAVVAAVAVSSVQAFSGDGEHHTEFTMSQTLTL